MGSCMTKLVPSGHEVTFDPTVGLQTSFTQISFNNAMTNHHWTCAWEDCRGGLTAESDEDEESELQESPPSPIREGEIYGWISRDLNRRRYDPSRYVDSRLSDDVPLSSNITRENGSQLTPVKVVEMYKEAHATASRVAIETLRKHDKSYKKVVALSRYLRYPYAEDRVLYAYKNIASGTQQRR